MKITFYGVRGSVPSPGKYTTRYGGNTSCVYIELESGHDIILDAGTGIRLLGEKLKLSDKPVDILLSHGHWDHIQGYPFFAPIYQPDRKIRVHTSLAEEQTQFFALFQQMNGASFPVQADDLPSDTFCVFNDMNSILEDKNVIIERRALNHPGGGSAYKITEEGMSCAFVTDNELNPPYAMTTSYDAWVSFCSGVDVLIHDAQYDSSDMPLKHGWGHSTIEQVRQFALDAEVGCLAMFHHDPDRTDSQLDFIQQDNDSFFHGRKAPAISLCAAEGTSIKLSAKKGAAQAQIEIS